MKFQNSSIHSFKVMLCIKKRDERMDGRTDGWTDGRTEGRMDPRMGTYVAMHFVAKIKWLLILSAYYCPSLCVYKLHLATLGMDYLSIAIILLCG